MACNEKNAFCYSEQPLKLPIQVVVMSENV